VSSRSLQSSEFTIGAPRQEKFVAIAQTQQMSEQAYREFVLGDGSGRWELVDGYLREKPGMSVFHGDVMELLAFFLRSQLDRDIYRVRTQHARTRVSSATYYVPDVAVVPTPLVRALREKPNSLDAYADPLPLVVEIWSPSTGDYDIDAKLPGYQRRGDLEIWYIHPQHQTLTAWRRKPDGTYGNDVFRGGFVVPECLPGVKIDLNALFAP
jgi:Uma2 family endonuclease